MKLLGTQLFFLYLGIANGIIALVMDLVSITFNLLLEHIRLSTHKLAFFVT